MFFSTFVFSVAALVDRTTGFIFFFANRGGEKVTLRGAAWCCGANKLPPFAAVVVVVVAEEEVAVASGFTNDSRGTEGSMAGVGGTIGGEGEGAALLW